MSEFDDLRVIATRLLAAVACGAVLGIDRDIHGKPAGLRVMSLVSLGGAIVVLGSLTFLEQVHGAATDGVLRSIQGLLSGIGFLGAGVILRSRNEDRVHGMTTSAAIWLSSIMGMTCGLGQWKLAGLSFLLTVFTLIVGRWAEHWLLRCASRLPAAAGGSSEAGDEKPGK